MLLMFVLSTNIEAKTLAELKSELSTAEEKYNNNQNEKEKTEAEIAATKDKITALNREKEKVQKMGG